MIPWLKRVQDNTARGLLPQTAINSNNSEWLPLGTPKTKYTCNCGCFHGTGFKDQLQLYVNVMAIYIYELTSTTYTSTLTRLATTIFANTVFTRFIEGECV